MHTIITLFLWVLRDFITFACIGMSACAYTLARKHIPADPKIFSTSEWFGLCKKSFRRLHQIICGYPSTYENNCFPPTTKYQDSQGLFNRINLSVFKCSNNRFLIRQQYVDEYRKSLFILFGRMGGEGDLSHKNCDKK